jgi:hypothetical protein
VSRFLEQKRAPQVIFAIYFHHGLKPVAQNMSPRWGFASN